MQQAGWKSLLGVGARAALAAVLLWLLLTRIDFGLVLASLAAFDVRWILPIIGCTLLASYGQAYQQSFGLAPLGLRFRVIDLFRIRLIAGFYTLVLPGVLSGGVSWYKLSSPERKGIQAGALLIYFRVVNTLVLLTLGVIGAWLDPRMATPGRREGLLALLAGALFVSLPFFSPAAARGVGLAGAALGRCVPVPRRLRDLVASGGAALDALHVLAGARNAFLIVGFALVTSAINIVAFSMLATAAGIRLPMVVLAWALTLVTIVQIVPISIGGLGVREASLVLVLQGYGVPAAQAMGLSLAMFCVSVTVNLLGAVLELWELCGRRGWVRRLHDPVATRSNMERFHLPGQPDGHDRKGSST